MNTALRNRYVSDGIAGISQEKLLVELYTRLVRDLDEAADHMTNNPSEAHGKLIHAQQILEALHMALDPSAWSGADDLADIYLFVLGKLVEVNVNKDIALLLELRAIIEPLATTWRDAYNQLHHLGAPVAGGRFETGA